MLLTVNRDFAKSGGAGGVPPEPGQFNPSWPEHGKTTDRRLRTGAPKLRRHRLTSELHRALSEKCMHDKLGQV